MRRTRLLPILLALSAAACSGQQASFLTVSNPHAGEVEERGLFTGDGPFAARKDAPVYAQPAYVQPQQSYAAGAYPQPPAQQAYAQQPYPQQAYAAQPPAPQVATAARGHVVEQRYGPNSYVMQYQPPPQATGGPYAPYGHPYAYRPEPQKPSPVY